MRIRTRLLVLVLGAWVPAVLAFGLLARTTYLRETELSRSAVQQAADSLALTVERELEGKAAMARALGASTALKTSDFAAFYAEASSATSGSGTWAILVTPTQQVLNTLVPFDPSRPTNRTGGAPFAQGLPEAHFAAAGPVTKRPVVSVFSPELGVSPPRYNVGIAFEPSRLNVLLTRAQLQHDSVASIVDHEHRVVARSRDGQKWLGTPVPAEVGRIIDQGTTGFAEMTTLDGVRSLVYMTRPRQVDWTVFVALPLSVLTESATRLTTQAVAASGAMLCLGLMIALIVSKRISGPVLALKKVSDAPAAQTQLPKRSGVREVDDVGLALLEARQRASEATGLLQSRVEQAVKSAEQAYAELAISQKREALGRLAGGLAHDLNNLLQTISIGLQMAEKALGDKPQIRFINGARRATAKAADLVRQITTFGSATHAQREPINLYDFLMSKHEMLTKAVGPQLTVAVSVEPGMTPVLADPAQLELSLLNLLFNARDATTDGSEILIRGRLSASGDHPDLHKHSYVCLDVIDRGIGMDAETTARATDPYFTTKPRGSSGLGLSQVHAFAIQSGGDLRIKSALGAGTCVTLCLPLSAAVPTTSDRGQPEAAKPLSILFVEDDVLVSSVLTPALEGAGHSVIHAPNADAALALLMKQRDDFDVLFTDVVMPGKMSGLDLARWCRSNRPELAVVVATGYTLDDTQGETVLAKPYSVQDLLTALQRSEAKQ